MANDLSVETLYRLPWTKEDNPNGWIEITTYCQLKCPGCYRGLAEENPVRIHEKLDTIKSDIDRLIKQRNIQTLSIAGGEPLLYPYLNEVVSYATSKGVKTKIITNGCGLTKNAVEELKQAGATEFVIHIDKFQKRPDMLHFSNTNDLRRHFCNIFREVKDVNLGFIIPVSRNNYSEVTDIIEFCKENSDLINLLVFTVYKDVLPNQNNTFVGNKLQVLSADQLHQTLCSKYNSKPCAFLGKSIKKQNPSWLFIIPIFYNNKVVGHLDGKLYKTFQNRYRKKKGKYFFTIKGNDIAWGSLILLLFKKPIINMFWNSLREFVKKPSFGTNLKYQVVIVIDGPDKTGDKWDICDGCPDAMIYKGKLVPSCLLERIKNGEEIAIR